MKNLIAQLLITLAEKEEESKKLTIRVEALEIVLTTLLRQMKQARRLTVTTEVESTLTDLMHGPLVNDGDRKLLYWHIEKILHSSYR
ncbi:sigma-S stabilization anti-adapter protein IraP [Pluralibacter gergoviae]|nr:anti-adapter protein IraP [Pluralibacter gergoviae]